MRRTQQAKAKETRAAAAAAAEAAAVAAEVAAAAAADVAVGGTGTSSRRARKAVQYNEEALAAAAFQPASPTPPVSCVEFFRRFANRARKYQWESWVEIDKKTNNRINCC